MVSQASCHSSRLPPRADLQNQLEAVERELLELRIQTPAASAVPQGSNTPSAKSDCKLNGNIDHYVNGIEEQPVTDSPNNDFRDVVTVVPRPLRLMRSAFVNMQQSKDPSYSVLSKDNCQSRQAIISPQTTGRMKESRRMNEFATPKATEDDLWEPSTGDLLGRNNICHQKLRHLRLQSDRPLPNSTSSDISLNGAEDYCLNSNNDSLDWPLPRERCPRRRTCFTEHVDAQEEMDKLHEVFEARWNAERQKLEKEYGEIVDNLRKQVDAGRRRNGLESERLRDRISTLEGRLNTSRYELEKCREDHRRTQQEFQAVRNELDERKSETERLSCDNAQLEQRCGKLSDAQNEFHLKHKQQLMQLENVIQQQASELVSLRKEVTKWKQREEETVSKGIRLNERNNQLVQEVDSLTEKLREANSQQHTANADHERTVAQLESDIHKLNTFLIECTEAKQLSQERGDRYSQELQQVRNELDAQRLLAEDRLREIKRYEKVSAQRDSQRRYNRDLARRCHELEESLNLSQSRIEGLNVQLKLSQEAEDKARNEIDNLQRRLNYAQDRVDSRRLRITDQEDADLVDMESVPISRLKKQHGIAPVSATNGTMTRPSWWGDYSGGPGDFASKGKNRLTTLRDPANEGSSSCIKHEWDRVMLRTAPVVRSPHYEPESCAPADLSEVVTLKPRCLNPQDYCSSQEQGISGGSLELLKAERRELIRSLSTLPRNSAFRTTEENEKWDTLKRRICELNDQLNPSRIVNYGDDGRTSHVLH